MMLKHHTTFHSFSFKLTILAEKLLISPNGPLLFNVMFYAQAFMRDVVTKAKMVFNLDADLGLVTS